MTEPIRNHLVEVVYFKPDQIIKPVYILLVWTRNRI